MIGYIVRETRAPYWLLKAGYDGTTDPLLALRFAREEDAHAWMKQPEYNAEQHEYQVLPILMSPQFPSELQTVRDAIAEAQRLYWHAENTQGDWFVRRRLRHRASRARKHAEELCYELFRRSILRELPKVVT